MSGGSPDRLDAVLGTVSLAVRQISIVLLLIILCLLLAQVVLRTIFDFSIFWFDELARYSYVWCTFIAALAVFADNSHVRIDIISVERFPRAARVLDCFAGFAAAVVLLWVIVESYPWLLKNARPKSSALRLPLIWFYGVVWLCYLGFVSLLFARAIVDIRWLSRHRKGAR